VKRTKPPDTSYCFYIFRTDSTTS